MLPVAILGLLIMSSIAVVALSTSADEQLAARATLGGGMALYAAEAGLQEVYATWDANQSAVDALAPGDSLDLGWRILDNGFSYRAHIVRWHEGDQPMYQLVVEGRQAGPKLSRATLAFFLTAAPGGPGEGYTIGECCEAAATIRGEAVVDGEDTSVDGHDVAPPGWEAAGACANGNYNKPGIRIEDASLLSEDEDATLKGTPPILEDPNIDSQTFNQFGPDLTWDEIKGMADFTWGSHGSSLELVNQIRPSYNADGSCDTTDPYNWGSNDPSDPCFDWFPIILVRGDFSIEASYGQAVFILDYYTSGGTNIGAEFDLDDDADLNGIILGKGCVELKDRGAFHGAIFIDGSYSNPLCTDVPFEAKRDAQLDYSQCAVDRAIYNSALSDYAEATVPGSPSGVQFLRSRSFAQLY